jgi:hypothetical protein
MHKDRKFFGLCLSGQQCDPAAIRHAECGGYALVVFKRDALRLHEVSQAIQIDSGVSGDLSNRRERNTFGLEFVLSRDLRPSLYAPDGCRQ